jgi:hypothetical protein
MRTVHARTHTHTTQPGLPNIGALTTVDALLLDQPTWSAGRNPEPVTMIEDFRGFSKNLSANPSTEFLPG